MDRIVQLKNNKEETDVWLGQSLDPAEIYTVPDTIRLASLVVNVKVNTDLWSSDLLVGNGTEFFNDPVLADKWLKGIIETPLQTTDRRALIVPNRVPLGFTVYPTGASDNISNGTYGNGAIMKMDDSNTEASSNKFIVQFLHHWYGIGGRIIWESASLADSISAMLVAPATTGLTQATGDYTKTNLGGPYNLIVPVTAGTGNWSLSLTATLNGNVQILKCTPVPIAGNTGWFDYNSDTNVLTRNMSQTGGYNLYDFDINLFQFARKIWGRKQDGAESCLESTDIIGKLLFNCWQIKFQLDNVTAGVKCGIVVTTAMKKNL